MNIPLDLMTLYEFKLKSDHEQYDLVFNHGQFLDFHLENSKRFVVYAVFRFFVEIEYDVASNKIVGKTSFVDGSKLSRYSRLPRKF